jgi:hypothetical protein
MESGRDKGERARDLKKKGKSNIFLSMLTLKQIYETK